MPALLQWPAAAGLALVGRQLEAARGGLVHRVRRDVRVMVPPVEKDSSTSRKGRLFLCLKQCLSRLLVRDTPRALSASKALNVRTLSIGWQKLQWKTIQPGWISVMLLRMITPPDQWKTIGAPLPLCPTQCTCNGPLLPAVCYACRQLCLPASPRVICLRACCALQCRPLGRMAYRGRSDELMIETMPALCGRSLVVSSIRMPGDRKGKAVA